MVLEFLENKIEEIKVLEYSKANIQKIIDLCLDIRNEVEKIDNSFERNKFIKSDLRQSTNPFVFLLKNDDHGDDVDKYWNDHKGELIFDLKGILRHLKK